MKIRRHEPDSSRKHAWAIRCRFCKIPWDCEEVGSDGPEIAYEHAQDCECQPCEWEVLPRGCEWQDLNEDPRNPLRIRCKKCETVYHHVFLGGTRWWLAEPACACRPVRREPVPGTGTCRKVDTME